MILHLVFDYEECDILLPRQCDPEALREGFFAWLTTRAQRWADTPCGGICATYGSGDFLDYLNEAVWTEGSAQLLEKAESADVTLRF